MAIQLPYTDGFITPEGGNNFESKDNKGQANGYAPLDANSKVPVANLPDTASLDAEVDGKIAEHGDESLNVHGIADTADLATKTYVVSQGSNHNSSTSVHGIANTADLVLTNDPRLADSRQPTAHTHAVTDVTGLQDALDGLDAQIDTHRLDTSDVHGIYDTAYLAYKEDSSNIFHRNLLGWPSGSMRSPRGTEQSFHNYGSSPILFDGTEGWSATSRPIYYVPIFIKNTASVQFSLRIPVKNYSGFISAALFAADNYNASIQPTSNGHMTLVRNLGENLVVNAEDETAVYEFSSDSQVTFGVKRGWHFIALCFSIDPTGKVYRSVYSPNGPTPAEQMFGMQQRRSFIEDATEKQRRIGSVIRRVDGAPTWPPNTSTAPDLFNYVENPVTPKLIYQFNGPNGSVAVWNPMNPRATYTEPSIDYASSSLQRFNDGNYPPTPTILSTSSASPQGGYNLLASAVPGALNINTSTRFQIDFSSASHKITEYRFYTRSTSTGPTGYQVRILSGPASPSVSLYGFIPAGVLSTAGVWQQQVGSLVAVQDSEGVAVGGVTLSAVSQLQIIGFGGSVAATSGNWRVDNIEIRGTYKHPDSPANWSGMTSGDHYFGFSEVVPLFYWGFNTLAGGSSV